MRVCGYKEIYNPHKQNEVSYARSLEASRFYPRFHIYTQTTASGQIEVSLHLDMKKPIYEGVSAHSGEYEGELVSHESQRVKNIADKFVAEQITYHRPIGFKKEEKSFWEKVFKFFNF